jgi:membrane protein DedA with SNARE-associated domain
MHWRSFVLWNALGGICWAVIVGLVAYFLGHAAGNAIQTFGLFGLVAAVLALLGFVVVHRRHRTREQGARVPPGRRDGPAPGDPGEGRRPQT